MYIERNGVKYELTYEELARAAEEYQKESIKSDVRISFAQNYLDMQDESDFDDFIENPKSEDFVDRYEDLCDSFDRETIDWMLSNTEEFLENTYKVYEENEDANLDFNSQIAYAIKTVLCDRAFEVRLNKVREDIMAGAEAPKGVGFNYYGTLIVNPFYNETGRFEVDPVHYYGRSIVGQFVHNYLEAVKNIKEHDKTVDKHLYEAAWADFWKLAKIVEDFEGSFEDLCIHLGGHNYEKELFDVNYGVLCATVKHVGAARWISTSSIDIWNDAMDGMIEECITLQRLKDVCIQLGVDVDKIQDKCLQDNNPSLRARIAEAVQRSEGKDVIGTTTISFTTNEGPDATQFDTQDPEEVLELFVQLLKENNLELVSVDGVKESEAIEKFLKVSSVDELLSRAKQACDAVNKDVVIKNDVEFGKE